MSSGEDVLDMSSYEDVLDCGRGMENFSSSYEKIHGYILLVMCVAGSAGNLINMAVLTHRKMRAPLDAIFTALATSHLLVLITLIPELVTNFIPSLKWEENYYLVLYQVCNMYLDVVVRLISSWLMLTLVGWGILEVAYEYKRYLLTMRRAIAVSFAPFLITPIVCVPLFITSKISTVYSIPNEDGDEMMYYSDFEEMDLTNATMIHQWDLNEIAKASNNLLFEINRWIFGVVLMIVPCIALAVLTAWLICASRKRRYTNVSTALRTLGGDESEEEVESTADTPTSLLIVMSAMFTLSTLPLIILQVLYNTRSRSFFHCAYTVHRFLNMIDLILPSVTCYLYCKMRREFWDTLVFIVKPECLSRRRPAERRHSSDVMSMVAPLPNYQWVNRV